MHVVLVHGMGRTSLSLARLARRLREDGHSVERLGYVAAVESFEGIRTRVRARLAAAAERAVPYAVVGHSLGGLVLRAAVAGDPPLRPEPGHVIMLGTPNQPPRLARRLERWWPYRLINGECGRLLAQSRFYAALPGVTVPTTIIAGTGGFRGRWSPFGLDPNDGTVAVAETALPGAALVELPVRHTFMMNDRRVVSTIRRLLVACLLFALLPRAGLAQRAAVPDDFPGLTWCDGGQAVSRIRADVQDSLARAQLEAHEAVHRAQAAAVGSCDDFLSGLTSARQVIDVELPAYCAQWRVAVGQGGNPAELRREYAWRIAAQSGAMENRLQVAQRFEQECEASPAAGG